MAAFASYVPAPPATSPALARTTNPINRPLFGFYVTPQRVVNQVIPVRLE